MNEEIRPKRIVLKITDDIDPKDVHCTTYQMRDVWQQIQTAMIGSLDLMSLHMHHTVALMGKSGDKVLDVCCGRAMILPLLRRYRPQILSYTGVDIWKANYSEAYRRSAGMSIVDKRFATNSPGEGEPFYPFAVNFVEADASEMADVLLQLKMAPFDLVIYTASVEHMQKEAGQRSIIECYRVLRPGGTFFLTTPNTEDKDDEYDTQYAAHLYEWGRDEILNVCQSVGFELVTEHGLLAKVRGYRENLQEHYPELVPVFDKFRAYLPSAWLYSIFPIITPKIADEIALIMRRP
jgi:ubiquinone/menaquinone biosynthesis C-methylase UbiE